MASAAEHGFRRADRARDRARRDDERARQVDLPRPAAAGEVAVDGADGDLARFERHARPRLDARAAGRIDELHADLLEGVDVAALDGVVADLLRAELDVELHVIGDALALRERAP